MKTKDLDAGNLIAAIQEAGKDHPVKWASLWKVYQLLPGYPEKIILSKLKNLLAKGRITGCACGCRGDFELVDA